MSSCADIITLALSLLGVSGGSRKPRDEDMTLGLTALQGALRGLIADGALGRANSVEVNAAYVAGENERILRQPDCDSIDLPTTVPANRVYAGCDYGMGFVAFNTTRPPRHGAFVVINDVLSGNTSESIYDAHVNKWVSITDLSLDQDSNAPLSANVNTMASYLATLLAPHYRSEVHPAVIKDAQRFLNNLAIGNGQDETRASDCNWF